MGDRLIGMDEFVEMFDYVDAKAVWRARANGYLPASLGKHRAGKGGALMWRQSDLDRYVSVKFQDNNEVLEKLEAGAE